MFTKTKPEVDALTKFCLIGLLILTAFVAGLLQ